jgi:hypothetical protein
VLWRGSPHFVPDRQIPNISKGVGPTWFCVIQIGSKNTWTLCNTMGIPQTLRYHKKARTIFFCKTVCMKQTRASQRLSPWIRHNFNEGEATFAEQFVLCHFNLCLFATTQCLVSPCFAYLIFTQNHRHGLRFETWQRCPNQNHSLRVDGWDCEELILKLFKNYFRVSRLDAVLVFMVFMLMNKNSFGALVATYVCKALLMGMFSQWGPFGLQDQATFAVQDGPGIDRVARLLGNLKHVSTLVIWNSNCTHIFLHASIWNSSTPRLLDSKTWAVNRQGGSPGQRRLSIDGDGRMSHIFPLKTL